MPKTIEDYSLAEVMKKIEEILAVNPEPVQGFSAIYQFDISGAEEGVYQLHFQEGKASVKEGDESPADCTLIMSLDNFRKFLLGNLNGTLAFMTGKLKIKGDIGKALKLENILKQYKVKEHL
ncbi:SCP2 sterol-binding domain-containing protein [Bacillus salipaludis]|uniref:SCP2 sterol-binding domain-containing protein n=1 Tax=Bacillus salipaludis TaxID=2547811 RepID=A0A4R5VNN5_9BACI|nr:SCP2 sterol-binding domain-containing protein [Bacillus salipaludis]MDQ6595981.1 SCP2 sterol-binding domain-containing protein [Bacillus salipaludis]TDK59693.1 SCP2 sterol-binding domain-containing protein [Bacillus salipaludis]